MQYHHLLASVIVCVLGVSGLCAQGTGVMPALILRQPGEGHGVLLQPPAGGSSQPTFTFPSTSGTLLVTSSSSTPSFGGLTVTGGPITLDPGVGNNLTFANIPADPLTTVFLTLDGSGRLRTNTLASGAVWLTSGTSVTSPGTGGGQQYLGTSNAQDLVVAANATERLRITSSGTVTLPNVSIPQGSRFSISGTYTSALTADATQVNVNTTLNGAAAAFAARGASFTTILTNNVNGLTLAGVYARTTLQNSSGTIADASGVYADFSRTSGGGSATITRYTGLRSRHITNNANISGIGLFIDGPNNTGVLPAGASFSGIVIDTIPASGSATRRVFFYNAAPSEQVLITAGGALALGTSTPASSSKLEVAGTAGTPNVRLSALGGTAKNPAPVGYDRIVIANTNGDIDQVAASAVASVIGAQPLDGDLTALAGLTTTGIVVRDNTNSMVTRTLSASLPISITNANGVLGDPTISLGTVPIANGGTNITTYATGDILYASAANTLSALPIGTSGQVLRVSAGGVPEWATGSSGAFSGITTGTNNAATMTVDNGASIVLGTSGAIIEANRFKAGGSTDAVDLATGEVAGTLPVANGGTGATDAVTARTNLGAQEADGDLTAVAALATTGFVVRDNTNSMVTRTLGATSPISITNADGVAGNPNISLGTVPIANGGTGVTATPINGQVLIGNGTGYVPATITAGTGITVTNGAGSITIATSGSSGNLAVVRNATTDATNADATYQDATELSATVVANTNYSVECLIRTQNSAGGHNMDIGFSFPSGTMTYTIERADANGGQNELFDSASPAAIEDIDTDDVERVFRIRGVLYIGGTGGTVQLQYRRTTNGTNTVQILSGSYMTVAR